MVTLYPTVVVWVVLVMVAVAVAGGVTVEGLTVHTGVDVVACVPVTWQLRATVPVKPVAGSTRIEEDDVPPGAIATGSSEVVVNRNSLVPWASTAGASIRHTISNAGNAASLVQSFTLDGDPSNFTMSRFN